MRLILVALFLLLTSTAQAQHVCPGCGKVHYPQAAAIGYSSQPSRGVAATEYASGPLGSAALQKARIAASNMIKGHVGGSLSGARFEGVGWSSVSAEDAIARCCYSGDRRSSKGPYRPRLGTAAVRSSSGLYFACILCQ